MDEETCDRLELHREILCCPVCTSQLRVGPEGLVCESDLHSFASHENIPQLYWPNDWSADRNDVTERMRAFYEQTPFPNYDDYDDVATLVRKAREGRFAQLLDDQIPPGARILECGCGTGQLSNFLSVANRHVFGADLCLNSLRLGQLFRNRNELKRVQFLQMNLFRPCFRPGSFDLVISNGVLHHTSDPELGFRTIAQLARPGGFVLIGLYHRYGRLITDFRRRLFRATGDRFTFLDPNLRESGFSGQKRHAWFMDQYRNPHESKHTLRQVLGWFENAGIRFVNSLPHTRPFQPMRDDERLFVPQTPGSAFECALSDVAMLPSGSREGGFFVVVGQRPEAG